MRKIVLLPVLMILMLSSTTINAQQPQFFFSHKTEAFTYFTGGTPFLPYFSDTLALGFDLKIGGVTNDTLYVTQRGAISTSGLDTTSPMFYSFGAEHSQGEYAYVVDTIDGKHVLKLQFKNARFDHDFTSVDYVNFQVWLYEGSNTIEVRIGNTKVANPDWSYYFAQGGAAIGMKNFWLKGAPEAPVVDTSTVGIRLTGTPDSGLVYQFSLDPPPITGLTESPLAAEKTHIYPNPTNGAIYIKARDARALNITDMQGRQVFRTTDIPETTPLPVRLSPGIYMVNILTDKTYTAHTLVVQ